MKKRKRILFFALAISVFGIFTWLLLRPSEPSYQGKPLTFWLEQFSDNQGPDSSVKLRNEAQAALQQIGSRAIPTCLRMMAVRESRLRLKFTSVLSWKLLERLHIQDNFTYQNDIESQHELGAYGIIALGPEAQPAIPAIEKLLKHKNPEIRHFAIRSLAGLGPAGSNAVPALIDCLNDPDPSIKLDAFESLGEIHQNPGQVIPILLRHLDSQNGMVRGAAIWCLGEFGPEAKPAVPSIISHLNDPNERVRIYTRKAILAIDPEAAAKAGIK